MIRLQRTGRKHEPTFRVVLTDSRNGPKSGKYLKNLGWYDTRLKNDAKKQLDTEAIKRWMTKGAKLSLTLHNFLVGQKIIEGKKLNALPRKSPIKKEEAGAQQGEAAEQSKKEEAKKEEAKPVEENKADAAPAPVVVA